jgi:hypothetical protein
VHAEGVQIIGRVTVAARRGSATVRIDGVTRASIPVGAVALPVFHLRRAAVLSGVLMISALDAVRVLVTSGDTSGISMHGDATTTAEERQTRIAELVALLRAGKKQRCNWSALIAGTEVTTVAIALQAKERMHA